MKKSTRSFSAAQVESPWRLTQPSIISNIVLMKGQGKVRVSARVCFFHMQQELLFKRCLPHRGLPAVLKVANNNSNDKQIPFSDVNVKVTSAKYQGSDVRVMHLMQGGFHSDLVHLVITKISNINNGSVNMYVYAKFVQLQKSTCLHAYLWTSIFYLCGIWIY